MDDLTTVYGIMRFLSKESDRLWKEYKKHCDADHDDIKNFRTRSNRYKMDKSYGGHFSVYQSYKKIHDANAVKNIESE